MHAVSGSWRENLSIFPSGSMLAWLSFNAARIGPHDRALPSSYKSMHGFSL